MSRLFRLATVLMLTLGMLLPAASPMAGAQPNTPAGGPATDLFFSEYIEGSSNNKALEIYNGTGASVDLSTYRVELYSNGNATVGNTLTMSGTLADGDVYVIANASAEQAILDVADTTSTVTFYNGDDAIVLKNNNIVIDSIGQVGVDPGTNWSNNGVATSEQTLVRKDTIVSGDTNPDDAYDPSVEWDSLPQDTFSNLGFHVLAGGPQPLLASCPTTVEIVEGFSSSSQITASDGDSTTISASLSVTETSTITLTNVTTSTGMYTASLDVADTLVAGTYTATINFSNNDGETATCNISIVVSSANDYLTIGEVQGVVTDTTNGATFASPYVNQNVTVRGVVYQEIRYQTSSGADRYGIFLQSTTATSDGNDLSSDGIYAFLFANEAVGGVNPQVGDEILITGDVRESFNMTQLDFIDSITILNSGIDIDAEVAPFQATPPANWADAVRYWERREGMRGQVVAGSQVEGGRDVFGLDAEIWTSPPGVDLTVCDENPYADRIFRDPHPCDNNPDLFDDGNGFRVLMGSYGVKYTSGDPTTLLAPGKTFDVVTNSPAGGVYYSFSKYMIQVAEQPVLSSTLNPALNAPPTPVEINLEFSTAIYNVENLYDFRDDPFDGCDFAGNAGCAGVNPPFNYVPASQADYNDQLTGLALQIVNDLYSPEVILIQEAEDQDICSYTDQSNTVLACGTTDNADGQADSLQDLAVRIKELGGPEYVVAYDRNGADDRGIVTAFMYRSDNASSAALPGENPTIFGSASTVTQFYTDITGYTDVTPLSFNNDVQNPKAFNATLSAEVDTSTGLDGDNIFTRAPQVLKLHIYPGQAGTQQAFYFVNNHFSSGPDRRVGQRTEQANYVAAIVAAIEASDPDAVVIAGGDLNVFPRPDDPFAPGQPLYPSDQLAGLYEQGMTNLWDLMVEEVPASAYSYHFQGQAQTLDQLFVNNEALARVGEARVAHINADWPADAFDPVTSPLVARGVSDHDPLVAQLYFSPSEVSGSKVADAGSYTAGDTITYTLTVSNSGDISSTFELTDTLDPALTLISTDMMSNGQMLSATGTISESSVVTYTIVAQIDETFSGTLTNTAYLSTMAVSAMLTSVVEVMPMPMPNISGAKMVNTTTGVAGEVFTYTIMLSNTGDFTGTYMLTDTLDANLTVVSTDLMGANPYTAQGELGPGAMVSYTLAVSTSATFTGTIDNSALVSVDGAAPFSLDAPTVSFMEPGDIFVEKLVHTNVITAGELLTYTIRIENTGEVTATYQITDVLNPMLSIVDPGGLAIQGENTLIGFGEVGPNSFIDYVFTVRVSRRASGEIGNSVEFTGDSVSEPIFATVTVTILEIYDIYLPIVRKPASVVVNP